MLIKVERYYAITYAFLAASIILVVTENKKFMSKIKKDQEKKAHNTLDEPPKIKEVEVL